MIAPLLAAVALSPLTSSTVIDQTVTCHVPVQAGIPILTLQASPVSRFSGTDGKPVFISAGLWAKVDDRDLSGVTLLGVANVLNGFAAADSNWCKPAPRIPLAPSGVPQEGVYKSPSQGLGEGMGSRCRSATTVTIRLRATILKGIAVAAQLAVRSGKKQRAIAYVDWSPKQVTTYLTDDCQS
jgi:hypothetical protein